MKKVVALVGALGCGEETSSGQIIRTNILKTELEKKYGAKAILVINTSQISQKPLSVIWSFAHMVVACKHIVIMFSSNGMKRLWPVFAFMAQIFKKKIYNNVIGGNLVSYVEKYPQLAKYMKSFSINWVQSRKMQKELEQFGVFNTEWLPNAKPVHILQEEEMDSKLHVPLRLCTFSRVSKSKGIELAVETVKAINEMAGETVVVLDIYGKPDVDYEQEFEMLKKTFPQYIRYMGVVSFDKSVDTLKQYFLLLFPSTFYGEGFPGTVIDAYASGIPVIASDWNCNSEVIREWETGLLYDYAEPEMFREKLEWAINNTKAIMDMRNNCLEEAQKYTIDKVYKIVFDRIGIV